MATIKLVDVSLSYAAPLVHDPFHLFATQREPNQEDLHGSAPGELKALDAINLTIPNGRTFVILGPSGCGKSTLLRVVAGIERDYSGQILYDGEDMRDVPPGRRYIGMVFQNYAL